MKALDIVATDSGVGRGCFQLPKFVPLNAEINVFFIIKVLLLCCGSINFILACDFSFFCFGVW